MAYDVTFTAETLCKGSMRSIGEVLSVDDETARMLVDLGVATASGLSPQSGSSAAQFADTFLAKADNLASVASTPSARTNLSVPSTSEVTSEISNAVSGLANKATEWSSATTYSAGEFVKYGTGYFVCLQANTNRNPFAELAYWQVMSMGWDWMVLPWKNLAFGNQRLTGGGVDASTGTTISYVRGSTGGGGGTWTNYSAVALYRTLSVGVPAYPHRFQDGGTYSIMNTFNMNKAGKFQSSLFVQVANDLTNADTVFYMDVGRTYNEASGAGTISTLTGPLDKKGFGVRFVVNSTGTGLSNAYASYHDGTDLSEIEFDEANMKKLGGMNKLEITWDGTGNMIWFINGNEVARINNAFLDNYSLPTWGAIAGGLYNNSSTAGLYKGCLLWWMCEETGFITQAG